MHQKNIQEIFARADLQQFREFLVSGLELMAPDKRSYSERLQKSCARIEKRIENIAKDEQELDEIYTEYSDATDEYMQVFLEIGMKAGAKLLYQLLLQNE